MNLPKHIEERFDKFVHSFIPGHTGDGMEVYEKTKSFIAQILEEEKERILKSIIDTEKYEQVMANLILRIVGDGKEIRIKDSELLDDYCVFSSKDLVTNELRFKVIKNQKLSL